MISAAPWADPRLVNAAIDLTCDVRELAPGDIQAQIRNIPPDVLAQLAIVLAAMVDVDEPLAGIKRWNAPDFVGWRDRQYPTCQRGHVLNPGNLVRNGGTSRRCATCNNERRRQKTAS